jgi:hypothetical protein
MLRYMSLDNACDAVSSLSRGFADLRIPAREWRLPFFVSRNISISALDVRRRRPSWPELHPERKGTLAREQRQRQGRLQNAGSPAEPSPFGATPGAAGVTIAS